MPTLCELSVGQQARVLDLVGEDAIAVRLMEMGLIEGTDVSYLGAAPLGDPLEFAVRGYRLSLRRSEADRVQVELLPVAP
ncbi:iron transporter [bacterium]|nr:iron transporter [bacterium]